MSNDTGNTPIGVTEAASRFEAYLSHGDKEVASDAPVSDAAEADEAEALAADDQADETTTQDEADEGDSTTDEDAGDEADEADGEADEANAEDDDASEQSDEDEGKLYTVKIDGKEEQVTLKEALNGYQRQADYTRSKMALAEEKKAFEPERDALRLERQQYSQLLPILIEELEAVHAEPDWDALIEQSPAEYVRQEKLWKDRQARIDAAKQEQARLREAAEKEAMEKVANAIKTNTEKLGVMMPQWKDPKRWEADKERILAYGEKLGWSRDELRFTYDARAITALYKAMRYDEIQAKRPKPQPASAQRTAPVKGKPVNGKATRETSEVTREKQRLAKTGHVRDAAKLFERLF